MITFITVKGKSIRCARKNHKLLPILLKNEFIISNTERKGSLCSKVKMADGSCYKLTTHFLKQVINSNNSNYTFWNYGKIKFIENSSEYYIDIDEKMDLMIFEKYFKK